MFLQFGEMLGFHSNIPIYRYKSYRIFFFCLFQMIFVVFQLRQTTTAAIVVMGHSRQVKGTKGKLINGRRQEPSCFCAFSSVFRGQQGMREKDETLSPQQ